MGQVSTTQASFCLSWMITDVYADFGVPLGNVPELEGMFDEDKSDAETHSARSDTQTLSKSDTESEYIVTRLWKYISSSQTTSAEKRPRDESDESQPSGKRRKMAAPWEL